MAVSEDEIILRARIRDEMSRQLREISEETLRLAGYMRTADGRLRSLNGRFASGRRVLALYNAGMRTAHRDTVRVSGSLERLARNAAQATRQITRLTAAILGLSGAYRLLGRLASGIAGINGQTKALIALFAVLIPAAVPFFAVTTASILSMGSAITSAGVALGVLVLAFSGVGEAVSALASGDIDKINEAFANLSTSGQDFARTLFSLKPALDTLRGTAQTATLPAIGQALQTLTQILPNLTALVAVFGGAIGQVAQQFANAFTSQGFTDFLQFLTDNVGDLNKMADAFINLSGAVGDLFVAFYPLNEAIGGGALERSIQNFADFASGATGTLGQFLSYVEDATPVVSQFYKLFGSTLLELLEQLGQPGIVVLQSLNALLGVLTDLAPTVGALAQAIGVGLLGVMNALVPILEQVGPLFGQVLVAAATAVADTLVTLAPLLGQIAEFLSQQLLNAVNALAPLLPVLGTAFLTLLQTFEPLLPLIVGLIPVLGDALIGVFAALTPAIGGVLAVLGPVVAELITGLAPILPVAAQLLAGLLVALTPLLPVLGDGLLQILAAITPVLPTFVDGLLQVVNATIPLTPAIVALVVALTPLIEPLLEIVTSLLPLFSELLGAIVPLIVGVADSLSFVLTPVVDVLAKSFEGIVLIFDKITEFLRGGGLGKIGDFLGKVGGAIGLPIGDTGAAHGSGSLGSTLASHAGILAGVSGGVAISNALIGGGGRGRGSGDHQAGRALDLVGPGVGSYATAARAQGHYAAMHGAGSSRHLHVAYRRGMGDTGTSMAPQGPTVSSAPVGIGGTVINFYGPVYGMEDFDRQVSAAVDEKNRLEAARRRNS